MRRFAFPLLILVAFVFSACATVAAKRETYKDLTFKPIKTDIPKTKVVMLKNGMVVHLLPDHELPLLTISAMIKIGGIWEPADKAGLASLTGATMRSGGTLTRPPDTLDETLEQIAASVETVIGEELGSASLSVLIRDIDIGMELFADVLRNPRFDTERFELAKERMLDSIRRENDNPTDIGRRELNALIYKGTPYGRRATLETVESITREDAIAFHKKYFVPQNIMLGVTGDFEEADIIAKLEDVFNGWSGPDPQWPKVKHVKESYNGGVFLVEKKLRQSVIRMGHLAIRRSDPDYHALRVMDEILGGGGFSSRLTQSIRTDRGLAYSVWSYYIGGRWELGRFLMGVETKTSSTAEVISIMLDELNKIRDEKVSEEELKLSKDSIVNSFIFIFDRPGRILSQRMNIDYYGLPDDYLESYRDKVMAVTVDDVQRVAKKYLHPNGLKIVVVGDPAGFDKPLKEFGKVEQIVLRDYSSAN